jgi:hypothetical protein
MQIYVFRDNQQTGPFSEAEVQAQLASGAITRESLVWWDGQPDWKPLGQTSLGAAPAGGVTSHPAPSTTSIPAQAAFPVTGSQRTSTLAVVSLVFGCIGWLCGPILGLAAVITGHMARAEVRKDPSLTGGGMALAGLILGYVWIVAVIIYFVVIGVLVGLGNQVKGTFNTINAQLEQATNNAPATPDNSSDTSTNNAPAPDTATNSPAATPTPSQ